MTGIDLQRHNVYLAERRWMGAQDPDQLSVRQAQDLVNQITSGRVWKSLVRSNAGVVVRGNPEERSFSYAEGNGAFLNLAADAFTLPVILHELAHILTMRVFSNSVQDHGPQYVSIYRMLVEETSPQLLESWDEAFDYPSIKRDDERVHQRKRFGTVAEM